MIGDESKRLRRKTDAVSERELLGARPAWYIAKVHAGRDRFAEQNLQQQGFVTFVPRQLKAIRHAGSSITRYVTYFHDHMFISINLEAQRWQSVNGTPGIRELITRGGKPAPVPFGFVEQFFEISDASCKSGLFRGSADPATIGSVHFVNIVSQFDRLTPRDRAKLLMAVVDRQYPFSGGSTA